MTHEVKILMSTITSQPHQIRLHLDWQEYKHKKLINWKYIHYLVVKLALIHGVFSQDKNKMLFLDSPSHLMQNIKYFHGTQSFVKPKLLSKLNLYKKEHFCHTNFIRQDQTFVTSHLLFGPKFLVTELSPQLHFFMTDLLLIVWPMQ